MKVFFVPFAVCSIVTGFLFAGKPAAAQISPSGSAASAEATIDSPSNSGTLTLYYYLDYFRNGHEYSGYSYKVNGVSGLYSLGDDGSSDSQGGLTYAYVQNNTSSSLSVINPASIRIGVSGDVEAIAGSSSGTISLKTVSAHSSSDGGSNIWADAKTYTFTNMITLNPGDKDAADGAFNVSASVN